MKHSIAAVVAAFLSVPAAAQWGPQAPDCLSNCANTAAASGDIAAFCRNTDNRLTTANSCIAASSCSQDVKNTAYYAIAQLCVNAGVPVPSSISPQATYSLTSPGKPYTSCLSSMHPWCMSGGPYGPGPGPHGPKPTMGPGGPGGPFGPYGPFGHNGTLPWTTRSGWSTAPWTRWWGGTACPSSDWPGWTSGPWATNPGWTSWTGCSCRTTGSTTITTTISGTVTTTVSPQFQVAEAAATSAGTGATGTVSTLPSATASGATPTRVQSGIGNHLLPAVTMAPMVALGAAAWGAFY